MAPPSGSAGPDDVAGAVLGLDQGGVDRGREARIVELDRGVGRPSFEVFFQAAPSSTLVVPAMIRKSGLLSPSTAPPASSILRSRMMRPSQQERR